jgi:hypothetical protein
VWHYGVVSGVRTGRGAQASRALASQRRETPASLRPRSRPGAGRPALPCRGARSGRTRPGTERRSLNDPRQPSFVSRLPVAAQTRGNTHHVPPDPTLRPVVDRPELKRGREDPERLLRVPSHVVLPGVMWVAWPSRSETPAPCRKSVEIPDFDCRRLLYHKWRQGSGHKTADVALFTSWGEPRLRWRPPRRRVRQVKQYPWCVLCALGDLVCWLRALW